MKEKLEEEKRKRQQLIQKEEKARNKLVKDNLIQQAYGTKKRTAKSKSRSKGKTNRQPWNQPPADKDS